MTLNKASNDNIAKHKQHIEYPGIVIDVIASFRRLVLFQITNPLTLIFRAINMNLSIL